MQTGLSTDADIHAYCLELHSQTRKHSSLINNMKQLQHPFR